MIQQKNQISNKQEKQFTLNLKHKMDFKDNQPLYCNSQRLPSKNQKPSHRYHHTQNDSLSLGKIVFNLNRSTKKQNTKYFLTNQYNQQYIQNFIKPSENISSNNQLHHQLCLQMVKLQHYHSIKQTKQQTFTLKKTNFKNFYHANSPIFRIEHLLKINFLNLKCLNISSQKISSIQGLSFIFCPVLQRLELHQNKISNANPLSKCFCKNLVYISFYDNPIVLNEIVFRTCFPLLSRIIIDSQKLQPNITRYINNKYPTMSNLQFIFKMQNAINIKEFRLNTHQRIFPDYMKKSLRNINPKIKLKIKLRNEDLMNRLLRIGGIARNNNPQVFQRFMHEEVEPVLRNRLARNPNHLNAINQIRAGLQQRLHHLRQIFVGQNAVPQIQNQRIVNVNRNTLNINPMEQFENLFQAQAQNQFQQVQMQQQKSQVDVRKTHDIQLQIEEQPQNKIIQRMNDQKYQQGKSIYQGEYENKYQLNSKMSSVLINKNDQKTIKIQSSESKQYVDDKKFQCHM